MPLSTRWQLPKATWLEVRRRRNVRESAAASLCFPSVVSATPILPYSILEITSLGHPPRTTRTVLFESSQKRRSIVLRGWFLSPLFHCYLFLGRNSAGHRNHTAPILARPSPTLGGTRNYGYLDASSCGAGPRMDEAFACVALDVGLNVTAQIRWQLSIWTRLACLLCGTFFPPRRPHQGGQAKLVNFTPGGGKVASLTSSDLERSRTTRNRDFIRLSDTT